jgi:hypothetical protein
MKQTTKNRAPWILLPCVLMTLGGVTLLVPHHTAQAAPPSALAHSAAKPTAATVYDDGDGDELLEHWDSPRYGAEERVQIGGAAVGFLFLGVVVWGKRSRRTTAYAGLTLVDISDPLQTEFLKSEQSLAEERKAA